MGLPGNFSNNESWYSFSEIILMSFNLLRSLFLLIKSNSWFLPGNIKLGAFGKTAKVAL